MSPERRGPANDQARPRVARITVMR